MDKSTALDKIIKCLALAASANEHEAAIALRQAQVMMRKHAITEAELGQASVREMTADAASTQRPPLWDCRLAQLVAQTFACELMLSTQRTGKAKWAFIGLSNAPDVAQYAYNVLRRQLQAARTAFLETTCKRVRITANKTKRADTFCTGWVFAASRLVEDLASQVIDERVSAYVATQHPNLIPLKPTDRVSKSKRTQQHTQDLLDGVREGREARLHAGLNPAAAQGQLCF